MDTDVDFVKRGRLPMKKFESVKIIKRPPQDVFDYIAAPANFAKWQSNTEYAEWASPGLPGIGANFKVVTKFLGGNTESLLEVTYWDPPNRYGFKSIKIPFPIASIEGITTLAPKENGTQLTLEGRVALVGLFKWAEGFFGEQTKKQDDRI